MAKGGVDLGNALIHIRTMFADKDFQKSLGKVRSGLNSIAKMSTIAGAAITAAVFGTATANAKAADEIAKLSSRIGFSTEEVSRWKHVLELGDASLSDLQTAMRGVANFLQEASRGNATYTETLGELGLSIEDLKGKNPEEVFNKLTQAVAAVEDPLRRTALGNDVFGRSFQALLPTLNAGAAEIERLKAAAKNIITGEQAKQAEAYNDAISTLKESLGALAQSITVNLIPILTPWIEKLTAIVSKLAEWSQTNPELVGGVVAAVAAIGGMLVVLGPVLFGLSQLLGLLAGIPAAAAAMASAFALLTGPIGAVVAAIAGIVWAMQRLSEHWEEIVLGMRLIWNDFVKDLKGSLLGLAEFGAAPGAFVMKKVITSLVEGDEEQPPAPNRKRLRDQAEAAAAAATGGTSGEAATVNNVWISNPAFAPGQTVSQLVEQRTNLAPAML